MFGSDELKATSPAFRDKVEHALAPLEDDRRISEVRTAYDGGSPEAMISENEKYALAVVEMKDGSSAELQNTYEHLRKKVRPGSLSVNATGDIPLNEDFEATTEADLKRAELVSLPLALLLLLLVFFSFGLAETVVIKAVGLGMGLAVMIDATIVRALLVPATMRLMGRWNWWAPGPLARLYDRLDLSEKSAEAQPPVTAPEVR